MIISITPERKHESRAGKSDVLGVRITVHVSGSDRQDKARLIEMWEALEDDDSLEALCKLIGELDVEKQANILPGVCATSQNK